MTNAEIQVGEWIRTGWGKIDKVLQIENIRATKEHLVHSTIDTYARECITKHSFNIIDLIEVGDYVNGALVDDICDCDNDYYKEKTVICNEYYDIGSILRFTEKRIRSIVTKEQFKAMEYEVGGEDE